MDWLKYVAPPVIQGAFDVVGGGLSYKKQKKLLKRQQAYNLALQQSQQKHSDYMQTKFATKGLSWQIKQMRAAGLSPIGMRGTPSYSPSSASVGMATANPPHAAIASAMGQNISRSVKAYLEDKAIEKADLENRILKADAVGLEIANTVAAKDLRNKQSQVPPSGIVTDVPDGAYVVEPTAAKSAPGVTLGIGAMGKLYESRTGFVTYQPTEDMADLISEDAAAKASWYYDLISYKKTISSGANNPGTQNHGFYLREKRKVEKWLGAPVYWHWTQRWRRVNWKKVR